MLTRNYSYLKMLSCKVKIMKKQMQLPFNVKQRFGFRKLSIGVVSVLLGTTFYMTTSGQEVHAATSSDKNDDQAEYTVNSSNDATALKSNKVTLQTSFEPDKVSQDPTALVIASSKDITAHQDNPSKIFDTVKTEARTDFKADKDKFESGEKVSFDFNTNEAKAGDVYKIIIPEKDDNFDGSGTYKVDAGHYQGNYGTTTVNYDEKLHQWVVTDTFTQPNASDQLISLTTNSQFSDQVLHSTGDFKRSAFLYKNDKLLKTIDFTQNVTDDADFKYMGLETLQNNSINKNADATSTPILANVDYQWKYQLDRFKSSFNHGTTIEIPMPDNFVLNKELTQQKNQKLVANYGMTVSSENGVVKVILPKLSDDRLHNLPSPTYMLDFQVVGHVDMADPDSKTELAATGEAIFTKKTSDKDTLKNTQPPLKVTVIGKQPGLSSLNIGDVLSGHIKPDEYETEDTPYAKKGDAVTALENKTPHDLNKEIGVTNVTPYDLNNVDLNLTIPDGMNVTDLNSQLPTQTNLTYKMILSDGTSQIGKVKEGFYLNLQSKNGQPIKSVQLHLDKLYAYGSSPQFSLNGTLAENYKDGSLVKAGQNLNTAFTVSVGNLSSSELGHYNRNQTIVENIPPIPSDKCNDLYVSGKQTNQNIGEKNAGTLTLQKSIYQHDSEPVTYYVVLPTNAELAEITNLPDNALVSQFSAKNRKVVKIKGNFQDRQNWQITLNNSDLINRDRINSNWQVFATMPEGEDVIYRNLVANNDLAFVENRSNSYLIEKGDWSVLAAMATYPTSKAQGNKDLDLTSRGYSSDKGSQEMAFTNIVVNSDPKSLNKAVIISNLPDQADGVSGFNFYLKNKDSVSLQNLYTGQTQTEGVVNYYSPERIDLATAESNPSLMSHFVTADKVTDWSKIRSVLTRVNQMSSNSAYGVILKGIDPTLENDVNKTAYTSAVIWSDLLHSQVIAPKSPASASITIDGISKVNFKLHFADDSRPDIALPAMTKSYTDGKDTLQQSDFIAATKNSDFDEAVEKSNYSKIPQAVIEAIPDDYVLEVTSGRIENSQVEYPDGRANGVAAFGQKVRYDFDGDTVVYDLVKKAEVKKQVAIERIVNYKDESTGEVIHNPIDQNSKTVIIDVIYNPLTGHAIVKQRQYADVMADLKLEDVVSPDSFGDYQHMQGEKEIIWNDSWESDLEAGLHKISIDPKASDFHMGIQYKTVNGKPEKPIKNDQVPADTIKIIQEFDTTYLPNRANLIQIGQGIGTTNKLLSESVAKDPIKKHEKIEFGNITDASLQRDGYSYKIYYCGSSLKAFLTRADRELDEENVIHQITRSKVEDSHYTSYENLSEALKKQGQYDHTPESTTARATQNFFVVYTPVKEQSQSFYILSDNDPYRSSPGLAKFALPESIAQANQSGTDYFKAKGSSGNPLIYSSDSNVAFNGFLNNSEFTKYSNGMYQYDDKGNPIQHNPAVLDSDYLLQELPVYMRAGYYVKRARYTYTDSHGKTHAVTISNHLTLPTDSQSSLSADDVGDKAMFKVLNYLTSGSVGSEDLNLTNTQGNSLYEITVDGLEGAQVVSVHNRYKKLVLDADRTWTYDETPNDNTSHQDPAPQILTLTYEAYPLSKGTNNKVTIHYVDVDQVDPITASERENYKSWPGINLPENIHYGYEQVQQAREYDPQSRQWVEARYVKNPISYEIMKADQKFDNTNKDQEIINHLQEQGYIVIQRDPQTRGSHQFAPLASDALLNQYDGNTLSPEMLGSGYVNNIDQNYYVYLKKAHPVNYKVLEENEKGNIVKTLKETTPFAYGGTNEPIASSLADPNTDSLQTIGETYEKLLDQIAKKNPDYDLVKSTSPDEKLKKTDVIGDKVFTNDPLTLNVYLVHKPTDSGKPEIPINPEDPHRPDTSDKPDPGNPDISVPSVPDRPDKPNEPEIKIPVTPDKPVITDKPVYPDIVEKLDKPSVPTSQKEVVVSSGQSDKNKRVWNRLSKSHSRQGNLENAFNKLLPQTGAQTSKHGLIGVLVLTLIPLFGLSSRKKRRF